MYPTISQYIEAVSEPSGFFRTLAPECERDIYGDPKSFAGGNAAVFKVRVGGKPYALKCYTRDRASVRTVYEVFPQLGNGLLYGTWYLPQEIYISDAGGGAWYDATLTEWAEGHTLEFTIRKAIHDGNRAAIATLAENFDLLAGELLDAPWAHGDLKPENIIVAPEGGMRLIDYDAMFVPPLDGSTTEETGTPFYQHPLRGIHHFDRHIDDYPVALISATLHALALETGLHGRFGNSDFFLFLPTDILNGRSEGYRAAADMAARRGEGLLYGLLRLLASPVPRIDGLKDIIDAMNNRKSVVCRAATPFAKEGRWGYMAENMDGSEVGTMAGDGDMAIPPIFDSALEFSEDAAPVSIGGFNHFIGRNGKCLLNCADYESVKPFSEGLSAVRRGGLWGYIDRQGREIITPQFTKASSIRNGRARVTETGTEKEIKIGSYES